MTADWEEIAPKVEYIKNRKPEKPNQIQAITGATISSDAVVNNINNAVKKVLANFPKDGWGKGRYASSGVESATPTGVKKETHDGGK